MGAPGHRGELRVGRVRRRTSSRSRLRCIGGHRCARAGLNPGGQAAGLLRSNCRAGSSSPMPSSWSLPITIALNTPRRSTARVATARTVAISRPLIAVARRNVGSRRPRATWSSPSAKPAFTVPVSRRNHGSATRPSQGASDAGTAKCATSAIATWAMPAVAPMPIWSSVSLTCRSAHRTGLQSGSLIAPSAVLVSIRLPARVAISRPTAGSSSGTSA